MGKNLGHFSSIFSAPRGRKLKTLLTNISSPSWEKIKDNFYLLKIRTCDIAYWVSLPVCDSCKLLGTVSFYHILVIITPQGVEVEELWNKDKHVPHTKVYFDTVVADLYLQP